MRLRLLELYVAASCARLASRTARCHSYVVRTWGSLLALPSPQLDDPLVFLFGVCSRRIALGRGPVEVIDAAGTWPMLRSRRGGMRTSPDEHRSAGADRDPLLYVCMRTCDCPSVFSSLSVNACQLCVKVGFDSDSRAPCPSFTTEQESGIFACWPGSTHHGLFSLTTGSSRYGRKSCRFPEKRSLDFAIARAETGRKLLRPGRMSSEKMEGGFSCSMHLPRTRAADPYD